MKILNRYMHLVYVHCRSTIIQFNICMCTHASWFASQTARYSNTLPLRTNENFKGYKCCLNYIVQYIYFNVSSDNLKENELMKFTHAHHIHVAYKTVGLSS